jgi:hypothetical protein
VDRVIHKHCVSAREHRDKYTDIFRDQNQVRRVDESRHFHGQSCIQDHLRELETIGQHPNHRYSYCVSVHCYDDCESRP